MKRLPPDKRNKLIMVLLGIVALVGLVYFFLIAPQSVQNRALRAKTGSEQDRSRQILQTIGAADTDASNAVVLAAQLKVAEEDMAQGDVVAWSYFAIQRLKAGHHVDINAISQPVSSDVESRPTFPYKQIKFQVTGSGFYQDIGTFIADLENQYPHLSIQNLAIDPYIGSEGVPEKLTFRITVTALLKPNA